jgi:predicted RNA methylase
MNLTAELQQYGIEGRSVRTFGGSAAPELLDYLDLVEPRKPEALRPYGVAESQGRPLLFFVDESHPALTAGQQDTKLKDLRRILACRGARSYLARILPGLLKVVPVSLDDRLPDWTIYRAGTGEALTFFSKLALGQYDGPGEPATPDQVFKEMFDLLKEGADRLAHRIGRSDVLSLIGRALFFRFLQDRQVITERNTKKIAPKAGTLRACFDTPENASATCDWLDQTFNGDFLHLSRGGGLAFFEDAARKTRGAVFSVLGAILRNDRPVGTGDYQLRFDWADFDFAHIPIGLLSQVYEKFIWTWADREARETSVYYTPRNIAAALVDEAFAKLPNAHEARVLDPACGAGVFLVLAFRRLYRERWKATDRRPDTNAIRAILENQLSGFDISDSALKLSALSLYLTAIELDPEPIPPEKLKFTNLRDVVLFNSRPPGASEEGITIGSLGPHLGTQFDAKFDLVVSNPPWTSLAKTRIAEQVAVEFIEISKEIIRRRGGNSSADAYQNPDNAPDLPFVWKATEWCKPGGRIAMALPARILLKKEAVPVRARHTLFRLLEVTGIINGSNLSDTSVWSEMQQPFMLLFARNRRPRQSHVIRFITPHYDDALNKRGEVRIDSKSAQPVELSMTTEVPWIWKALAVGTSLDCDVVRKLTAAGRCSFGAYWQKDLQLTSCNGYQIKPEQKPQLDATFLRDLPDLNDTGLFEFVVRPDRLQKFAHPTAYRPRKREVYRKPLVLVKESPGVERERGRALLSGVDVAFNESFHGFSGAGHPEGNLLVRYVHLFVHSQLWMHYALVTSPKFGAERRKVYKSDLDDFPIVPLSRLSEEQRRELWSLSKRLERGDTTVFPEVDKFFGGLYGLDALDVEVIQDTLSVCLPYKESRERACQRPDNSESQSFCQRLESLLLPFFKVLGKYPEVMLRKRSDVVDDSPFSVLTLGIRGQEVCAAGDDVHRRVLQLASETGATQMIRETEQGLVIGILNQYRYWTPSRARLLAADILQHHAVFFEEA